MKKLLYFSHGLSANGIETFLFNVLGKIDKTKYDITVIIAIDEGVGQLHEQEVLDMGIKVIHAGDLDGIKKKLAYIKNVKRILSEEHFDIAHSNMDLLNGITLSIAKKAGIPKRVCHAHTSKSQYKSNGTLSGLLAHVQKTYSSYMRKQILKSSTDLLACSDVAGEYFYGNNKFVLIYNGIDYEKFRMPSDFDSSEYVKAFNLTGNEKHLLVSVGRISDVKNPLFAMEIIAQLKELRTDFKYIWVGNGELEDNTKQKAKELGIEDYVIFTGVRTDIPQILNCGDLFLMPSLFEGLPFSLVEAQAAGLLCIVSDVVTETANIGTVKYLSLEKGAKGWAEFINSEIDRPVPKIDEAKAALFSVENTVSQLEKVYEN